MKIEIDIDCGEHHPKLVALSIEKTLKAVAKDRLCSDDADAVFELQSSYVRDTIYKPKPNIFDFIYPNYGQGKLKSKV